MKIHTGRRDAMQMELAELEAINRHVIDVQATTSTDEREEAPVEVPEETKKSRKKKKEADV